MNNSINTDLKNMFAHLHEVFCFLSLNILNSIYIVFQCSSPLDISSMKLQNCYIF